MRIGCRLSLSTPGPQTNNSETILDIVICQTFVREAFTIPYIYRAIATSSNHYERYCAPHGHGKQSFGKES